LSRRHSSTRLNAVVTLTARDLKTKVEDSYPSITNVPNKVDGIPSATPIISPEDVEIIKLSLTI